MLEITRIIQQSSKDYYFSGLQPFVFNTDCCDCEARPVHATETILACPFPFFSIEWSDSWITFDDVEYPIALTALCCKEITPGIYDFVVMEFNRVTQKRKPNFFFHDSPEHNLEYQALINITQNYLSTLHTTTTKAAKFTPSDKVVLKTNGKKSVSRISSIIYITEKNSGETTSPQGQKLHWDHSWSVRAHWRCLNSDDSIGRDRKGNRAIKGYTWVGDYIKGSGSLSKRTRIVNKVY